MAQFKGQEGHWITTKDGRHLFISEDLVDKQEREIKEQQKLTAELNAQHNNVPTTKPATPKVDYSKLGSRDAAVSQFEKDTGVKVMFDHNDDKLCTKTNLYMVLNQIAEMKQKYPTQLRFLKGITTYHETPNMLGGVSMASANPNYLNLNDYIFSKHNPQVESLYSQSTSGSRNYHPKGTTAKDIITHELGHVMFFEHIGRMNRRLTKHDPIDLYDVTVWTSQDQGGVGTTSKYIKNEMDKALTTALGTAPQHNILGYANPKFKHPTAISGYAASSPHELMAEAVADYVANGDKASPLSKELVKILHM